MSAFTQAYKLCFPNNLLKQLQVIMTVCQLQSFYFTCIVLSPVKYCILAILSNRIITTYDC